MKLETVCDLCFDDREDICEIVQGYYLIKHEGVYKVLEGPCHRDNVLYTYSVLPYLEPGDDSSPGEWNTWFNIANCELKLNPEYGWRVIEQARSAGYDPDTDGLLSVWLFTQVANKMGV